MSVLISRSRCSRDSEAPRSLSLGIPDSSYSGTPVPATRGCGAALYRFSMNHRQQSLQTETGPNVTQFLQVSITPRCFFGRTICLKLRRLVGRCTAPQRKEEDEEEDGQIRVSRTMRTKQIGAFLFRRSSLFLCQQPRRLRGITHN